jgi:hypothetical protein
MTQEVENKRLMQGQAHSGFQHLLGLAQENQVLMASLLTVTFAVKMQEHYGQEKDMLA